MPAVTFSHEVATRVQETQSSQSIPGWLELFFWYNWNTVCNRKKEY